MKLKNYTLKLLPYLAGANELNLISCNRDTSLKCLFNQHAENMNPVSRGSILHHWPQIIRHKNHCLHIQNQNFNRNWLEFIGIYSDWSQSDNQVNHITNVTIKYMINHGLSIFSYSIELLHSFCGNRMSTGSKMKVTLGDMGIVYWYQSTVRIH